MDRDQRQNKVKLECKTSGAREIDAITGHRYPTDRPQVIHRLSTGYPQVIHRPDQFVAAVVLFGQQAAANAERSSDHKLPSRMVSTQHEWSSNWGVSGVRAKASFRAFVSALALASTG